MHNRQQTVINTTNCLYTKATFIGPRLQFSAHSSFVRIENSKQYLLIFSINFIRLKLIFGRTYTMENSFENKSKYDIKFISVKRTFKSSEYQLVFNDEQFFFVCVFILFIKLQRTTKSRIKADLTLHHKQLHLNHKTKTIGVEKSPTTRM